MASLMGILQTHFHPRRKLLSDDMDLKKNFARKGIDALTSFKTSSEILSEFVALDFHDLGNKKIAFENSVI